jgi:omega-amidase
MKVALVQTIQYWENIDKNLEYFYNKIQSITENVDIIVLPEMFTTGFTMQATTLAEKMDGKTMLWLQKTAAEKNSAITTSLVIVENGNYYNRMVFVAPNGKVTYYNKRHLFTLAGENKIYTKGQEKVIVTYKNIKICLQVCYDLRFPVFTRNTENYDMIIYVANWPKARIHAWDTLLKARAIENQCFVVAVNRIGEDANNLEYPGHSTIINELGENRITPNSKDEIFIEEININEMYATRKKLAFLNDQDLFSLL